MTTFHTGEIGKQMKLIEGQFFLAMRPKSKLHLIIKFLLEAKK